MAQAIRALISVSTGAGETAVIYVDDHLAPAAIDQVKLVMARRGMKLSEVMKGLGFATINLSLGLALNRGSRNGDPAVLVALGDWLKRNTA